MKVFQTVDATQKHISTLCVKQITIGFVPTMGALHEGHLSLVQRALLENDHVAVSIFVNPTQFNNPTDLDKYPRNLEADLDLLRPLLKKDDFIFTPSVSEVYPEVETNVYDFGSLATVMEGRFRPGHFNGVGMVLNRLFRIISPDKAYLGEKDFQQIAITKKLLQIEQLPLTIISCPIIREPDGLAMSSRNTRLTPEHRAIAPTIFSTINLALSKMDSYSPEQLKDFIISTINQTSLLEVEYVEFADEASLKPIASWTESRNIRCFIAVQAGEVRLIDNIACNILPASVVKS
jgi:pantoate--beta-alanine ligase